MRLRAVAAAQRAGIARGRAEHGPPNKMQLLLSEFCSFASDARLEKRQRVGVEQDPCQTCVKAYSVRQRPDELSEHNIAGAWEVTHSLRMISSCRCISSRRVDASLQMENTVETQWEYSNLLRMPKKQKISCNEYFNRPHGKPLSGVM